MRPSSVQCRATRGQRSCHKVPVRGTLELAVCDDPEGTESFCLGTSKSSLKSSTFAGNTKLSRVLVHDRTQERKFLLELCFFWRLSEEEMCQSLLTTRTNQGDFPTGHQCLEGIVSNCNSDFKHLSAAKLLLQTLRLLQVARFKSLQCTLLSKNLTSNQHLTFSLLSRDE